MTAAVPRFGSSNAVRRDQVRCWSVILVAVVCWSCPAISRAATIIHAGRLIDGRSNEAAAQMSIVVEDGKITSVVPGYVDPKDGDTLVKLTEHTVMPGLMDMHTHLQSQHSEPVRNNFPTFVVRTTSPRIGKLFRTSSQNGRTGRPS